MNNENKIILSKTIGEPDARITIENWSRESDQEIIKKEIDLFMQCAKQLNELTLKQKQIQEKPI